MILILLPAYNEAPCIGTLLSRIKAAMETQALDYRVLVVNDGSRDDTLKVARKYVDQMPLEVLNHRINRGLWETVRDGFEWAAEHCKPDDIIIRMDADDTHAPEYIPAMDAYRTFASRCANLVMKLFFPIKGLREYSCGYRAYSLFCPSYGVLAGSDNCGIVFSIP